MKYLVTGGAGFIGSNIVKALLMQGDFVRVADNFATGRRENIQEFLGNSNFELIEGDLTDLEIAKQAVAGMDIILHQAAINSVPRSIDNPILANNSNINGTLNLLIAAKEAGIKKLVYASSSSVYGDNPELPKKEDFPILPISPYALSKYAGERYCQIFTRLHALPTVCLRYFNVFGPNQNPDSQYAAVIPKFITIFLAGGTPTIFGTGEQTRDFTFVENVVQANLLAAKSGSQADGQVFNIACGQQHSLNDLVGLLNEIMGTAVKPEYMPERKADVLHTRADIVKAETMLGYKPLVSFKEGLKKTVEYYKQS